MSFEPKTWETGEVIKATDFNAVSPYISEVDIDFDASDDISSMETVETAGDIISAINAGRICFFIGSVSEDTETGKFVYLVLSVFAEENSYSCNVLVIKSTLEGPSLSVITMTSDSLTNSFTFTSAE